MVLRQRLMEQMESRMQVEDEELRDLIDMAILEAAEGAYLPLKERLCLRKELFDSFRRQKILVSQMLAVWIFNFIALVLTKVLIYGCVLAGSHFMTSAFPLDFNMASLSFYVQLILKSVVIVSMSFIALFIGLAMKSSKATIISSFLLIFLTQANIGDFTMKNNLIFPVILTFVSLIFAALSVYNVETKDLM